MFAQEQHEQEEQKAKPAAQEEKKAQPEKSAKQEEKPAAQQEKNTKPEEKNAKQEEKNRTTGKQQEKNTNQQKRMTAAAACRNQRLAAFPKTVSRPILDNNTRSASAKADYSNHRFQYGGYWFGFVDPWPSNWLYTQDVYVVEINGVYYLCNAMLSRR